MAKAGKYKKSYWTSTYDTKKVRNRLILVCEQGNFQEIPPAVWRRLNTQDWLRKPSMANDNVNALFTAIGCGYGDSVPAKIYNGIDVDMIPKLCPKIEKATDRQIFFKKLLSSAYLEKDLVRLTKIMMHTQNIGDDEQIQSIKSHFDLLVLNLSRRAIQRLPSKNLS